MESPAIEIFQQLQSWSDIDRLFDVEQEENTYLDYKIASMSNGKLRGDDIDNFAKAVSGFANTSGGVLVWGIETGDGVTEESPIAIQTIANVEEFRKALQSRIQTITQPAVAGIDFHPIYEFDKDNNAGVLVMLVPESNLKPHMAMGKSKEIKHCYFRRVGSNFKQLDHGELDALFARKYRLSEIPRIRIQNTVTHYPNWVQLIAANLGDGAAINIEFLLRVMVQQQVFEEYTWVEPILLVNQTKHFEIILNTKNDESLDLSSAIFQVEGTYQDAYGQNYEVNYQMGLFKPRSAQSIRSSSLSDINYISQKVEGHLRNIVKVQKEMSNSLKEIIKKLRR